MKVSYLRCPKCGVLLGTIVRREKMEESKCYWSILAINAMGDGWKDTSKIECANCNTIFKVYHSKNFPFLVRRTKK